MQEFLNTYHFLKSRKFWAVLLAWVTLLSTSIAVVCLDPEVCTVITPFPWQDFTTKTIALVLGYIATVAFEDGMAKRGEKDSDILTEEEIAEFTKTKALEYLKLIEKGVHPAEAVKLVDWTS